MPPAIQLRIGPQTAPIARDLAAVARRCKDLGPALQNIGARLVDYSIPLTFQVGGRPKAWPRSARDGQTMLDTRILLDSITYEVDGGTVRVGTNLKYAAQRHFGGPIEGKGKLLAVPADPNSRRRRPSHYGDRLRWAPVSVTTGTVKGRLVERTGRKAKRQWTTRFWLVTRVEQPPRPFLIVQPDDEAAFQQILYAHILEGR